MGRRVGCCGATMGMVLVLLNSCFVLAGLCIAAGGIYLSVRLWDWALVIVPLCLFALGLLVVVVSLLGCMGALRKSRCLLCTYFILIALLLVGQGFALTGVFVVRSDASKVLADAWDNHLSCDDKNAVETEFSCCGWDSYPPQEMSDCKCSYSPPPLKTPPTCESLVVSEFQSGLLVSGIVLIVLIVAQLVGLFASFCMCNLIRETYYSGKDYVPLADEQIVITSHHSHHSHHSEA